MGRPMRTTEQLIQVLESRSILVPDGCWLWQGALDTGGYGVISYHNKSVNVHRLAAHIFLGLNMEGDEWALHHVICPNRNCWNPDHLYRGDRTDNFRDSEINGTRRKNLDYER